MQFPLVLFVFLLLHLPSSFTSKEEQERAAHQYIQDAVEMMKLEVHKASFKRETKRRTRRSLSSLVSNITTHEDTMLLTDITPHQSIEASFPLDLEPFQIGNNLYMAVINHKSGTGSLYTNSYVYKMNETDNKFYRTLVVPTFGGLDFEFADYGMEKFLIFVAEDGENWYGGTSIEKALFSGLPISSLLTRVSMEGARRVKSYQSHYRQYFVTAVHSNRYLLYGAKSTLHMKSSLGYQLIQTFETQGAEDVETFVINEDRYIAFANYINNALEVDIYSVIYRIKDSLAHETADQFVAYQSIFTHGAKDFEYFQVRGTHYLAVSNYGTLIGYTTNKQGTRVPVLDYNIDSVIYWWSGKFFIEYQKIPTIGAFRMQTFSIGEEVGLVISNSKAQAVIYTYDFHSGVFKPAETQGLSPFPGEKLLPDVRSVRAFEWKNATYLSVANYNTSDSAGVNVFRLNFTAAKLKLNLSLEDVVYITLKNLQEQLKSLSNDVHQLRDTAEKLMLVDTDQTVPGSTKFNRVIVNGTLSVQNLLYKDNLENNPIEQAVNYSMTLKNRLIGLQRRLHKTQEQLNISVYINGSYAVGGNVTFQNSTKITNSLTVGSINSSGLISGVNLSNLHNKALKKSINQTLTGRFVFKNPVYIRDDIAVSSKVNGIRIPDDIMTTNTIQTVYGNNNFTSDVEIYSNVSTYNFLINNMNLKQDVLLRNRPQSIRGVKRFQAPRTRFQSFVAVHGLTDGVNFSRFADRAVLLSKNQTLSGQLTFKNGFHVDVSIHCSGFVDGVNLTKLSSDLVLDNVDQNISGTKIFLGSVNVAGNISIVSTVNERSLKDIMTTHTNQTIKAAKEFPSIHVLGNISTNSTIDGINLRQEAVTKEGNQILIGHKTFTSKVISNDNVDVVGKVDGVDLSEWKRRALTLSSPEAIPSSKNFSGKVVIEKHLNITNRINEIKLREFVDSIVTKDTVQMVEASVTFRSLHLQANLEVGGKLNSVKVPEDLVPLAENVTVRGKKSFVDDVVLENQMEIAKGKKLNEESLPSFIKSVVISGKNQTIDGQAVFSSPIVMQRNLTVNGRVNTLVVPDDLFLLEKPQNITSIKNFKAQVKIDGELNAGNVLVKETVNSVDVSELYSTVVKSDENSTIIGNMYFSNTTTIQRNLTVSGQINGIDIQELKDSVVSISTDQEIGGHKVFQSSVRFFKVDADSEKINNINITKLNETLVKKDKEQEIEGEKTFLQSVNIDGSIKDGPINGINFAILLNSTVSVKENATVDGNLTFLSNVTFDELQVLGNIDGLDISNNVMKTFGNQTVTGQKKIIGDMGSKNIHIKGKIGGVDLSYLNNSSVKLIGDQRIHGRTVFAKDITLLGDMHVHGGVNGVDISALYNDTVLNNQTVVISGKKRFMNNVYFEKNIRFHGNTAEQNLSFVFSDALYKSKNETITGRQTYISIQGLTVEPVLSSGNITVRRHIDGVNITDFNDRVLLVSTNQVIKGKLKFMNKTIFKSNLQLKGLLNGINTTDVMTISDNQTVTGHVSFQNLTVKADVLVSGQTDTVDLSDFSRRRVTLTTNQSLNALHVFKADVVITGNMSISPNKTINGIDLGEEILFVEEDSVITGPKVLVKDLGVGQSFNVSGTVNGVDLRKLQGETVYIKGRKHLFASVEFYKNLTILGNVRVSGYINGVKVMNVSRFSDILTNDTRLFLNTVNCSLRGIRKETRQLAGFLESEIALRGLRGLDMRLSGNYGIVDVIPVASDILIAIAGFNYEWQSVKILRCNLESKICDSHQDIYDVKAETVTFFAGDRLFVQSKTENTSSQSYTTKVYTLNYTSLNFEAVGSLTMATLRNFVNSSANVLKIDFTSLFPVSFISQIGVQFYTSSLKPKPLLDVVTFKHGHRVYTIRPSILSESRYLELYRLYNSTLAVSKVQRIASQQVISIDVAYLKEKTLIVVTEKQEKKGRIRVFTFGNGKLCFLQMLEIKATSAHVALFGHHYYLVYASHGHGFGLCKWQGHAGFDHCMLVQSVGAYSVHTVHIERNSYVVVNGDNGITFHKVALDGILNNLLPNEEC